MSSLSKPHLGWLAMLGIEMNGMEAKPSRRDYIYFFDFYYPSA